MNFITAHDGFTLNDLVSYNEKHNEANGEENRDGNDNNISWNGGAEGPTDDAAIVKLREQQKRNMLATLFLSQGVPMLLAGDEVSRTQQGNNNSYCQDNEINWLDWNWDDARWRLLNFTKRMIALRREHPILRRRDFFKGVAVGDQGRKDVGVADARRPRDDTRGVGQGFRALPRHVAERRAAAGDRRARPRRCRTRASSCSSTRTTT